MPSIEAARLCDRAPADGILVSSATKMLAGRVEGARFESTGAIGLKGIPEPMEAFAVVWEPLADESGLPVGAWPVPPALRFSFASRSRLTQSSCPTGPSARPVFH